MKLSFARAAMAASLMAAAAAQAQVVTVTGWTFGAGNGVDVGTPVHQGYAGGFHAVASGLGAGFDGSFETYCVDLTKFFIGPPSPALEGYSVIAGASNTDPLLAGGWGADAAAISARLGQLMTYVGSDATLVDTAAESTSLQLAIWNVIYDSDNTLAGGAFMENSGSFGTYANALLAGSLTTVNNRNVYVLHSEQNQDFLVTTPPVPEPSTYALMLAGLAGIGFVARRRTQR